MNVMRTVKKMASAATITVFLLCCFVSAWTGSPDGCDLYGATGDNIVVPLNSMLKERFTLKWRHNDTVIFNQKKTSSPTVGSKDMVYANGSLKLTSLKKSHSGTYSPEVFNQAGKEESNLKAIRLCVLDRVQKPVVKKYCLNMTDVMFTCTVEQKQSLEYKWFSQDKELKGELKDTLTRKAEDVINIPFACEVSNPISSEISDPVTQECVKFSLGMSIWISVGIVLVLSLTAVTVCIWIRRRRHATQGSCHSANLGPLPSSMTT